jgi:thiol-disulfide isomerase/thioredoxin
MNGSSRRQCLMAGLGVGLGVAAPHAALAAARPGEAVDWPLLTLLDGSTLAPSAWQDSAAVVVFWATWCAHCRRHNAHLDKLHRALAGRAPRIVGVAVDSHVNGVRQYMAANGYQFPVTLDAEPLRSRLTARRSVPMTCTIDARGHLKQVIPGEMFEADVLELARLG